MAKKYIDSEVLMNDLHNHYEVNNAKQNAIMDEVCMIAFKQPTANVQEVEHGEWKKYDENIFECSECGYDWYLTNLASHPHDNDAFYCPCCGAKMNTVKEQKQNETN